MASGSYVTVTLTSNVSSYASEKRFPLSTTIGQLKMKLELITGATSSSMSLQLMDDQNKPLRSLNDDLATLETCGVENYMIINVTNTDPSRSKGEFEDLSKVEKYDMSEEDYTKRGDSVRAFKEKMKLGRFAEGEIDEKEKRLQIEEEVAKSISTGLRCEVTISKSLPKRGVVMYIGPTHFKEGYWIGVKYDEPLGKNNGSVDGKRYFDCPLKYGAFIKPTCVKVGDYPELSFSDDEM